MVKPSEATAQTMAGPALAVQAREVVVSYDRLREKDTLIALQDFNLDIRQGEFMAIVGPSGCGKSTFLNVVAGLTFPVSGEVQVMGKPVTGPETDRAVVFQDYALMRGGRPRPTSGSASRCRAAWTHPPTTGSRITSRWWVLPVSRGPTHASFQVACDNVWDWPALWSLSHGCC